MVKAMVKLDSIWKHTGDKASGHACGVTSLTEVLLWVVSLPGWGPGLLK